MSQILIKYGGTSLVPDSLAPLASVLSGDVLAVGYCGTVY